MARLRVIFEEPQQLGGATVSEVVVEGDRLTVVAAGEVVLDVDAEALGSVTHRDGRVPVIDAVRAQHPNAYRAWLGEDDGRLLRRREEGATVADLAEEFGRDEGAIKARLRKLDEADQAPTGQADSSRGWRSMSPGPGIEPQSAGNITSG